MLDDAPAEEKGLALVEGRLNNVAAIQGHYHRLTPESALLLDTLEKDGLERVGADGEAFDPSTPSAAHKTLPLPCIVEVTNLDNGRKIRVRVNDRGPFAEGRILDVSRQAAEDLGFLGKGMAKVRVRYIGPAPLVGRGETARYADGASTAMARADAKPAPASAPAPLASAAWRIQAGAFADRGNAERAAQTLSSRGQTSIEPMDRGGDKLWKVMVAGAPGETPEDLRGQVASQGFPGAKVIGPS